MTGISEGGDRKDPIIHMRRKLRENMTNVMPLLLCMHIGQYIYPILNQADGV